MEEKSTLELAPSRIKEVFREGKPIIIAFVLAHAIGFAIWAITH